MKTEILYGRGRLAVELPEEIAVTAVRKRPMPRLKHPEADLLHRDLDSIAAEGSDCGAEARDTLSVMRDRIAEAARISLPAMPASAPTPRLTESWFCCAEPTPAQATSVGLRIGRVPLATM